MRADAAQALGEIGHKSAVAPLQEALNDGVTVVRYTSIRALGMLEAGHAIPKIIKRLSIYP